MSEVGFDACFRAHVGRLIALGRAVSGDQELARDLAQETFLRLHRQWDRLDDRDEIGGWLTRVMANLLIDHHRSSLAERQAVARLRGRRPEPAAAAEPMVDSWSQLISGLPPRQRVIVTLHYGQDLSIDEIVRVIEVSNNTVKSALSKARTTLRSQGETDGH
jgi:RNA polymerase sigma-70 factor (ECF subfamily)